MARASSQDVIVLGKRRRKRLERITARASSPQHGPVLPSEACQYCVPNPRRATYQHRPSRRPRPSRPAQVFSFVLPSELSMRLAHRKPERKVFVLPKRPVPSPSRVTIDPPSPSDFTVVFTYPGWSR